MLCAVRCTYMLQARCPVARDNRGLGAKDMGVPGGTYCRNACCVVCTSKHATVPSHSAPTLVQVKPVKGVYIYRFQSPLYFANGAVFKARLAAGCGIDPYHTKEDPPGCLYTLFRKVGLSTVWWIVVLLH